MVTWHVHVLPLYLQGLGWRVQDSGVVVQSLRLRAEGSGFRVQG